MGLKSFTHAEKQGRWIYGTDNPEPLLRKLEAIHIVIRTIQDTSEITSTHIYTHPVEAVKHPKRVKKTLHVSQNINEINAKTGIQIYVHQIGGHDINTNKYTTHQPAHEPPTTSTPPILMPPDPSIPLLQTSLLKKRARALIPPCAHSLHRHLTPEEEVLQRRLRAGVALPWYNSSVVVYNITRHRNLPRSPDTAVTLDVQHILWSSSGANSSRDCLFRESGVNDQRPGNLKRWLIAN